MNPLTEFSESTKKCGLCFASCEKKCGKCWKVGYCSPEHQKIDRRNHMEICYPAVERRNDKCGNFLVATRSIEMNEIIRSEEALVVAPTMDFSKEGIYYPICLGCCKVLPGEFGKGTQICSKCGWPLCEEKCDKIKWHSEAECSLFQIRQIKPKVLVDSNTPVALVCDMIKVLRMLLLKERKPTLFKKFLSFESHIENRRRDQFSIFVIDFIRNVCGFSSKAYPDDLIKQMYGIVIVNSTTRENLKNIGPGQTCESFIQGMTSKLLHSCVPNTKAIHKGWGASAIFAIQNIQPNDTLYDFYIFDQLYWMGTVERRQELFEKYHFWCECQRCSDPSECGSNFSAIKCNSCVSGYLLPKNSLEPASEWTCDNLACKATLCYDAVSKIVAAVRSEISSATTMGQKLKVLRKHANVTVHYNHSTLSKLRFDLLPLLLEKCNNESNAYKDQTMSAQLLKDFARTCLESADELAPGLSSHRGILLFYLAQGMDKHATLLEPGPGHGSNVVSILEKLDESTMLREEAQWILKVLPKGATGNAMYKTLIEQEKQFTEGLEELNSRMMNMRGTNPAVN